MKLQVMGCMNILQNETKRKIRVRPPYIALRTVGLRLGIKDQGYGDLW